MGVILSTTFTLTENDSDITTDNPIILWDNQVSESNPLAASGGEATGYPVSQLNNPATDLMWVSGATSTQYLTHTTTGATYDTVGIANHNWGTLGKSVSLEVSTGGSYSAITTPEVPADDSPIIFRFTPTSTYTGIRIKITEVSGSGTPEAAVVFFGRSIALQRRIYVGHTPLPYGRNVMSFVGRSQGGSFLGEIVTAEYLQSKIDIQNMTPGWYRTYLDPFIRQCKRTGFFFAWRPATYPLETGYCWVTNNPQPENQRPNGMMQISIDINGIGAPSV